MNCVFERACQFIGGLDLTPGINMNSCQLSSLQRGNTRSPAIEQFRRIRPEVTLHRPDADASTRCTENLKSQQRVCWLLRRSEEHTSELQSRRDLVCRLLLEKK